MPKGVSRKQFITICTAYRDMLRESLEDVKTAAMMGAIQKNIPEFFKWLEGQDAFTKVGEVKLREFSSTMIEIAKLPEGSLTTMIKHLEKKEKEENAEERAEIEKAAAKIKKEREEHEAKEREKEISKDPPDNTDI